MKQKSRKSLTHRSTIKGFTLIELLVVISIISLLASVVLVSLNSARTKARNVRRNSDIKQLINAFNLGLDTNNNNLPVSGPWVCISASCYGPNGGSGGWSGLPRSDTVDAYLAPYIQKPVDPTDSSRPSGGYAYSSIVNSIVMPYDGTVIPAGAYLDYRVEPPVNSSSCGGGYIYSADANSVECLWKID